MDAQEKWDKRYALPSKGYINHLPTDFVQACLPHLPATGYALDVAAGTGRHTLALAQRGLQVDAIDISGNGLILLRQRFSVVGVPVENINRIVADVERPWLPHRHYDVILVTFFLYRPLFPLLKARLRPGGYLIYETFLAGSGNKSIRPGFQLQPGELLDIFSDLEIIAYDELRQNDQATVQLLARKGQG